MIPIFKFKYLNDIDYLSYLFLLVLSLNGFYADRTKVRLDSY